jgi:hypothetical protein
MAPLIQPKNSEVDDMKTVRWVVVSLLFLALQGAQVGVDASSHGMEGYAQTGCNCHGSQPGTDANVTIEGIPDRYYGGTTYVFTIALEGGPVADTAAHQGGFNLQATAGSFKPVDASTHVMDSGDITHEHAGANQRAWTVEWEAPISEKAVNFYVAGNIVDGDHQPTDGDDWALASYTTQGESLSLAEQLRLHAPKFIALALFGLPVLYIFWQNRAR